MSGKRPSSTASFQADTTPAKKQKKSESEFKGITVYSDKCNMCERAACAKDKVSV